MQTWKTTLRVTPEAIQILVTTVEGDDILKAHLAGYPGHPRALLTVLEGLALWSGQTLCAAISADVPVSHSLGLGAFTDDPEHWPEPSPLVDFVFIVPSAGGRRITGVGDFSRLRKLGVRR